MSQTPDDRESDELLADLADDFGADPEPLTDYERFASDRTRRLDLYGSYAEWAASWAADQRARREDWDGDGADERYDRVRDERC